MTTTTDISTHHGAGVRASDAEREDVARILRAATGQGLLTADLPDERHQLLPSTPPARGSTRARLVRHTAFVAVVAVLLVAAWLNSDAEFFWPVWPIGFLVLGLVRHARGVVPSLRTQPVS